MAVETLDWVAAAVGEVLALNGVKASVDVERAVARMAIETYEELKAREAAQASPVP